MIICQHYIANLISFNSRSISKDYIEKVRLHWKGIALHCSWSIKGCCCLIRCRWIDNTAWDCFSTCLGWIDQTFQTIQSNFGWYFHYPFEVRSKQAKRQETEKSSLSKRLNYRNWLLLIPLAMMANFRTNHSLMPVMVWVNCVILKPLKILSCKQSTLHTLPNTIGQ